MKTKLLLVLLCLVNVVGIATLFYMRRVPKPSATSVLADAPSTSQGQAARATTSFSSFELPPRPEHAVVDDRDSNPENIQEIIELRSLAFDIAENAARKLNGNPAALSLLGKLHLRNSNPEAARILWDEALVRDASAPEPYVDYGHLELNLGNLAKAEENFREALKRAPQRTDAYPPLVEALVTQSKFSEAVPFLNKWLANEPQSIKALNQLGKCQQELGEFDKAVENYQTALKIDSMSRESVMGLMATYRAKGDRDRAAETAKLFATIDASDPRVAAERNVVDRDRVKMKDLLASTAQTAAQLFVSSGDVPTAIELLEQALEHLPDAADIRGQLSDIYIGKGRYDQAIQLLQEPCTREPDNANAWLSLALTCMKLRQLDAADGALKQVIRILPNDDLAFRLLTQTQIAQQRDLPGAVASAKRAIELSPVASNHYWLATALYHNSDFPTAKAELQKAIALEPSNEEYRRALAAIP